MTTTLARPVICGHCSRGACGRCPGRLDAFDHRCACTHTPKPAVPAAVNGRDGDAPALEVAATTPGAGAPSPEVDLRLDSALSGLACALEELDGALLGYLGAHTLDPVPVVITASALAEFRRHLGQLHASVESVACRALRSGPVTLPDGRVAERLGGQKRSAWEHDRLAHRVAENAAATVAVVPDADGAAVLDEGLAAAVHAGVQALLACARPNWRTTDLKARGIRFDDLVTSEPGNASLKVSAPASES